MLDLNAPKRRVALLLLALCGTAVAQERIWRCGNEYTNNAELARQRGCLAMDSRSAPVEPSFDLPMALTVQVDRDGHFRLPGSINGKQVVFLVDTGASFVSVSDELGEELGLIGAGRPAKFATANGVAMRRMFDGVSVTAGPFTVPTQVAVGAKGLGREVLLGQSFLSNFEVTLTRRQMLIKSKAR